jgi:hypothetical protein
MNIQLWSSNFDPEPTGIGIVSTVWARGLRDRGHRVSVVAAQPHYPAVRRRSVSDRNRSDSRRSYR